MERQRIQDRLARLEAELERGRRDRGPDIQDEHGASRVERAADVQSEIDRNLARLLVLLADKAFEDAA